MKIIKRNGAEAPFEAEKIFNAISKANKAVEPMHRISDEVIRRITEKVTDICASLSGTPGVEDIQDLVEREIMAEGAFTLAKTYITYRYTHELVRRANTTDDRIMSLIERSNEEIKTENSNKNPTVNSVQRDYMAGEVSKDITRRMLLPEDIVKAHDDGIIHFHDADYFAQHMHNCDLVNLEDMLQNGTVISGTMIERPHSFSTACNIATQIIAQVASNQYGGQSISLTHRAPFVQVSREKIRAAFRRELELTGVDEAYIDNIVENDVVIDSVSKSNLGTVAAVDYSIQYTELAYNENESVGVLTPVAGKYNVIVTVNATAQYEQGKGYSVNGTRIAVGEKINARFPNYVCECYCISIPLD